MTVSVVPKISESASIENVGKRDSYAVTAFPEIVDRSLHAAAARFTMGLSPTSVTNIVPHPTMSPPNDVTNTLNAVANLLDQLISVIRPRQS
jgi:hypothetical protein